MVVKRILVKGISKWELDQMDSIYLSEEGRGTLKYDDSKRTITKQSAGNQGKNGCQRSIR